jgi:glycosyltransferase 2 family protein
MKRKLLGILKYLLFLSIGIFLVWWQLGKMTADEKQQFTESLKHARYWLIAPVALLSILSHISRAIRWRILIEPMGYQPRISNAFFCLMTGYLINTFVPRAGELLKCSLLSKYEKIPTNKLIGTMLIERAFDLSCYFLLILFTILLQLKFLSSFVNEKLSAFLNQSSASGLKFSGLILLLFLLILLVRWLFRRYTHHKYVTGMRAFYVGMKEGFITIKHLKKRGKFIGHTVFIWLMYLMQIYIGFYALSATAGLSIIHACSVLSLATLGMIVSPGGIGAFPVAVQEVLKLYNIKNISFGWLMWGVTTAIVVVGGLISFVLLLYRKPHYEASTADLQQNLN